MIKLIDILKGTIRDPFTGDIYEGLIKTVDTYNNIPSPNIVSIEPISED